MKYFMTMIAAFVLCLGFIACGDKDSDTAESQDSGVDVQDSGTDAGDASADAGEEEAHRVVTDAGAEG